MQHHSFFSKSLIAIAITLATSSTTAAHEIEKLPSSQSFTGLMFIPNAQVMDTGRVNLSFHQGIPYQNKIQPLDDWYFSAGLFPGLEAGGRIVTKSYQCNLYTEPDCGIRDLSMSLKYQLPFIYQYTGINMAIGMQDIGGAANNFDTKYVVLDKMFDSIPLRLSVGYAKSNLDLNIMNGLFTGFEWQPLPFLQLIGEYDSNQINASAKLFTPKGLLPLDAQISADYQLYSGHKNQDHNIFGINASIPLMGYSSTQYKRTDQSKKKTIAEALSKYKNNNLHHLINTLQQDGFLNIQFGHRNGNLVIALENRRYNHNPMDGLGIALGIIAEQAKDTLFNDFYEKFDSTLYDKNKNIELIMLKNDIPMILVSANMDNYRQFLINGTSPSSLTFNTYNTNTFYKKTQWLIQRQSAGFGRSQLILSPELEHRTATEYGFFDYSLALATNVYTPLWKGSAIDIRHTLPLSNSDDFNKEEIWEDSVMPLIY